MKKSNNKKIIIFICILVILIAVGVLIFNIFHKNKSEYELIKILDRNYYTIYQDNLVGVINTKGEVLVEPKYNYVEIPNPTKPVFICLYNYNEKTDEYQSKVLNDKGETLFSEYDAVYAIQVTGIIGDIPYEKSVIEYKKDGKYGLIDLDGQVITKPIYEEISSLPYKEGEIMVKQNGKYGIISTKGTKIVNTQYDSIIGDGYYDENEDYLESGYIVGTLTENGYKYSYINSKGEKLTQTEYNDISRLANTEDKKNVYLLVTENGKKRYIKK